jgi:sugar/nucleoside kinase (ribokinase family)
VHSFRPYPVKPIDTTGAGDAFRAGIIFGLLKQWPDHQIIRYAAAVAAMVCATAPAAVHGPRHSDVLAFLRKHSD